MKPSYRTLVWRGDSVKKKHNTKTTLCSPAGAPGESYGGIKLKTRGGEDAVSDQWFPFWTCKEFR